MNKFNRLSNVNQLVIMDSILKLKSKGIQPKSIQRELQKDLGYKLKIKTINYLSERESSFKEFENLLTQKNLMY